LDEFYEEIITANLLVIHNSTFDIGILMDEFNRMGNMNAMEILNNSNKYCTMKLSKKLVKALDKRGNIKNPRLEELYEFLFNEKPDKNKLHDALYDVECLARCYFALTLILP